MEELMKIPAEHKCVTEELLVASGFKRPAPDKIFPEVKRRGVSVLAPASNAIDLVLRKNLFEEPTLEELVKIVATNV
jgi:hypothetical protein